MILGFTGHRPDKLGKWEDYHNKILPKLTELADIIMFTYKPNAILSGMALGWDTAVAISAIQNNINLLCAIPYQNQDFKWRSEDKTLYKDILSKAKDIIYVDDLLAHNPRFIQGYQPWKLQERNKYIVNHCDTLIALYNGQHGGTRNCVLYAEKRIDVINVWEDWKVINNESD